MKQMSVQKMLSAGLVLSFMAVSFAAAPVADAAKNLANGQLIACGKDGGDHHGKRGMHKKHHKKNHQEHFEKMAAELGLTDEQKAQWEAFRESFREQNADRYEAMKARKAEWKAAVEANGKESPEAQAIKADMKAQWTTLKEEKMAHMRTILTPEQYEKFEAMKAERKARWEQKKQEREKRQDQAQ